MATSVGQIALDLVVNDKSFKQQMSGIQGMAKKAGLALAAAFSVKKLIDFSAQCIELGSDLVEVQNVVDVTFPQMSKQVDAFAKNAAVQFGLSETMAKKFSGTFGAMSKAFGFGERQAYEMSTALTGLAGDVASFYNISQDEAYTKLKSIFTGETESLKDLGVVMTQTALDSYALANGFGKTTAQMSEMEKVALRYKFVQDQLSLAAGDFSRTSDGWANQVRILKLQFDSLKATIGQGLINVLTPVIKVINTIIGKLMSLANAFKSFTELITGKKSGGSGTSSAVAGLEAMTDSADKASSATNGVGSAAKKAAKDIKGIITPMDELHVIDPDESAGSSSGSGSGYGADFFDMGEVDTSALDETDSKFQKLIDRMKELAVLAKKGFWDGFGDKAVFDSIQNSITSIKASLKDIFTSPEVVNAANGFADSVAYNLGRVAGSVASVGATIADNLLGGISRYLEQNSSRIKDYLVSMFNIGSRISEISGNFASAVAEIFSVFRSDSAKQITADIIGIFYEVFMGITELLAKLGEDLLNVITKPIIDNKDAIKAAIQGLLDTIQPIISRIKELLDKMFDGLNDAYDKYAKPVFDTLAQKLSDVVAWCLENASTIEKVTTVVIAFFAAWETVKLGEFVINAGGVISVFKNMFMPIVAATTALLANAKAFIANTAAKIADKAETAAIVAMYAKDFVTATVASVAALMKQAAQFAINTAAKAADAVAQAAMTAATVAWNAVCAVATALTTALGVAVAFLTSPIGLVIVAITALIAAGVLLYRHWDEIKAQALKIWESIRKTISDAWDAITKKTTEIWTNLKTFISTVFNAINTVISAIIRSIQTVISTVLVKIKSNWENIWNSVKIFASTIFNAIHTVISTIIRGVQTTISTVLSSIKSNWENVWNSVKTFVSSIFNGIHSNITEKISSIKTGISNTLKDIKSNWESIWKSVKSTTVDIFNGIWGAIKGSINSIIGGVEKMANGVIKGLNAMINALNKLKFDVPDWVPEIGGKSFGFHIGTISQISIPKLAQGGYVKANTPRLAMIGDNRRYGEIVAPEDKMQEMVNKAVALAGKNSGMSDQYLAAMVELLKKIIDLIEGLDLTVSIDIRDIRSKLAELEKRSGYRIKTT